MRIINLSLKNNYSKIIIIIFVSVLIDNLFILKINHTEDLTIVEKE